MDKIKELIKTDILVIGGGVAGVRAAVGAYDELDSDTNVILATKAKFGINGSSFYPITPGWGFQAAQMGDSEDIEEHYEEAIDAAQGMANPNLTKILVEEAPFIVDEMKEIGLKMNVKNIVGDFSRKSRAVGVLDRNNIKKVFTDQIKKRNIQLLEGYSAVKIIKNKNNHCRGALFINKDGEIIHILAKAVIIATGGYSNIYKYNLNSPDLRGDGYALALNSGAELTNLEYMQYMFGFIKPRRLLFPEKLFSLFPPLYNKNNNRFLNKYIPDNLSLEEIMEERSDHGPFSTNYKSKYFDIACYQEMQGADGVYVDLKPVSDEFNQEQIVKVQWFIDWVKEQGIDLEDRFLIAPCACVANGGIVVDENCESKVSSLYAAGEIMAGPHGADRLGGNMMSSVLVFGKRAGQLAARKAVEKNINLETIDLEKYENEVYSLIEKWKEKNNDYSLQKIKNNLKEIMWDNVAICRDEKGLKEAIEKLNELKDLMDNVYIDDNANMIQAFSILNGIDTALSITKSAYERKESRGPHYRTDYPKKNNEFEKPLVVRKKEKRIITEFKSIY